MILGPKMSYCSEVGNSGKEEGKKIHVMIQKNI